tara:strand:+ start:368 stop:736 length:369 start_codon:yes stop_codon:yes gene_type:complete
VLKELIWRHKKENAQLSMDIHGMIDKTNSRIEEIQEVLKEDEEESESEDESANKSNNTGSSPLDSRGGILKNGIKSSRNNSRTNNDSRESELKECSIESLKKDSYDRTIPSPDKANETPEER